MKHLRKILLLTEAAAAGVGRHVLDLASGLAERSFEVHVAYSPFRMDEAFRERMHGCPAPGALIFFHRLPMRHAPHPADPGLLVRLISLQRRYGPFDIVHCHSTKAGLIGRLPFLFPGARRIYTPHALPSMNPACPRPVRGLIGAYEKSFGALFSHGVIAVSPDEQEHLRGIGIAARRLFCVPNGVDVPSTVCRRDPRDGAFRIGYLGRLAPQKRVDLLLRAFAGVVRRVPHAELAVAGSGPLEKELGQLASTLRIEDRVSWLGPQKREILRRFDVLALSSDYEALPYVVLEALAHGVPVAATRVGGVPLLIEDGVHGHTVPVGDADALSDALVDLAVDSERRHAMSHAARIRASHFSLDRMVEETLSVYREAEAVNELSPAPGSHARGHFRCAPEWPVATGGRKG